MHLVACARPTGALEDAPRTSLRPESDEGRWDGFWCAGDEGYYTRRTRRDGSEEWFRVADEDRPVQGSDDTVLPLRPRIAPEHQPVMVLVTRSARGMLVGTARRRPR